MIIDKIILTFLDNLNKDLIKSYIFIIFLFVIKTKLSTQNMIQNWILFSDSLKLKSNCKFYNKIY